MNELIKIKKQAFQEEEVNAVDARELHVFLESKQDFSTWIKNRVKQYGFVENQDFVRFHKKMEANNATMIDYTLSIDMAKELSMVERNAKGKEARQYFIQCEKVAKEQSTVVALLPAQIQAIKLNNIEKQADLLERFGFLDERDRMDLADAVRNTGRSLLPARTDAALPVTISGRAIDLGIKLDRGDVIRAGRITAALYRDKHGETPVKHTQYVDGAARQVNSYTENDLDIIDSAIRQAMEKAAA